MLMVQAEWMLMVQAVVAVDVVAGSGALGLHFQASPLSREANKVNLVVLTIFQNGF